MSIASRKDTDHSIEQELLALLSRQASRVPIPVFLSMALIAAFSSRTVDTYICVSWLMIVLSILVVRRYVLSHLPDLKHFELKQKVSIAVSLSAINGIAHGMSLYFFLYIGDIERILQTLIIVGLCAGSVGTTAGFRSIFMAYLIPTLPTLSLAWLVLTFVDGFNWIAGSVFLLTAMFTFILFSMSKDSYRLFSESFQMRAQKNELNEKLESALEEAKSANNAKTRFLASASHDLRQPIHTLSLLGASLSMRPLDEHSKRVASNMNSAIQSLAKQLDALLDISKLDAGIVEVNKETINLSSMCHFLCNEFSTTAKAKNLKLVNNCPEHCFVYTDPSLLERILRNLISNSIKYTEEGTVTLFVDDISDGLYDISVIDSGVGIKQQDHKLVFEEFYQSDNPERDRNKGLGLGLAIVKRLVALLDIELSLISDRSGTHVKIKVESSHQKREQKTPMIPDTFLWQELNVLIVDDEEMVRVGMKTLLESLGSTVKIADGSSQTREMIEHFRPDIILSDFRLRNQDNGLIAIKHVLEKFPGTPAILISGDTAPDRLVQAQQAGIPLLHKPVSVDRLKQAIFASCRQSRESIHEQLQTTE